MGSCFEFGQCIVAGAIGGGIVLFVLARLEFVDIESCQRLPVRSHKKVEFEVYRCQAMTLDGRRARDITVPPAQPTGSGIPCKDIKPMVTIEVFVEEVTRGNLHIAEIHCRPSPRCSHNDVRWSLHERLCHIADGGFFEGLDEVYEHRGT